MRTLALSRFALSTCIAALLAGCSQPAVDAIDGSQLPQAAPRRHSRVFRFIGGEQHFPVPAGVTKLTITASGASGATTRGGGGGRGGLVSATIPVTPGERLGVFVGGEGGYYGSYYGAGGYNGGGFGDSTSCIGEFCEPAGGGGGASDIREGGDTLQDRILVAAGGGGQGCCDDGDGGAGGVRTGANGKGGAPSSGSTWGSGGGGAGGTQSGGGSGGTSGGGKCGGSGTPGTLGQGGNGGNGCTDGGGGGGGYYGGGGGGGAYTDYIPYYGSGGGGGGGSSYAEPSATGVKDIRGGAKRSDGKIVITWDATDSRRPAMRRFRMLPEAKNENLVYVPMELGYTSVNVYSYPKEKLVGDLQLGEDQYAQGICADAAGDVFVTSGGYSNTNYIYEYAHGGSEPIAQLAIDGYPTSCASDPKTNNFAVADEDYEGYDVLALYQGAQGSPTYYNPNLGRLDYCTYDKKSDVFVSDGLGLAELPDGSSTFESLSLPYGVRPAGLQWYEGTLLASSASARNYPQIIWRLAVTGTTTTLLGTSTLDTPSHTGTGVGAFAILGRRIVMPNNRADTILGIWHYPKGGVPERYVQTLDEGYGVAVSLAPK